MKSIENKAKEKRKLRLNKNCVHSHLVTQRGSSVLSASGNSLELLKSDLLNCQSLLPIRGWSSALNCNAILLFFFPPFCFLFWSFLILSPTFPVSASDQMVWNKSIYKGIRVKQPCFVLFTAKHRKQIIRNEESTQLLLKVKFTQMT